MTTTVKHQTPVAYAHPGLILPETIPKEFKIHQEHTVKFNPAQHLQIEKPSSVRSLEFQDVPFPYSTNDNENTFSAEGFAFTPPFRLLSEEGAKALRQQVEEYKAQCMKQNERSVSVRGLGYVSCFVNELMYCPQVVDLMAELAREPLWPHHQVMNHAHTNVGMPGTGKAVDQWHFDSVDYVCIVLVSDGRDMKGGELQLLQMAAGTTAFDRVKMNGIPSQLVESVQLQELGTCILLHGSKVMHSVTPVLEACEARHSVILPFTNRNVFSDDPTRLDLYRGKGIDDPIRLVESEYARHKAWRIHGQMQYILDHVRANGAEEDDTRMIADLLGRAAAELTYARQLLLGEISDDPGFLVNEHDKVTQGGRNREGGEMKSL